MPRACTICSNPQRHAIDRALTSGDSYRRVAPRFAISPDATKRHAARHLPKRLTKAQAVREIAGADQLLDELRKLYARAHAILDTAEDGVMTVVRGKREDAVVAIPDLHAATRAIREARGCLELVAKVTGLLKDGAPSVTVNLVASPEWAALRTLILYALRPYPEALAALEAALAPREAVAA